jgi:hypothetical protein
MLHLLAQANKQARVEVVGKHMTEYELRLLLRDKNGDMPSDDKVTKFIVDNKIHFMKSGHSRWFNRHQVEKVIDSKLDYTPR